MKGERSYSPKAAMVRRPYPPGVQGKRKRMRRISEYGSQLLSKQKVRLIYRVLERQFEKYVEESLRSKGSSSDVLVRNLERRLDNVVFRMGLATARDTARQLVSHGHLKVNGKPINIPSYRVEVGDVISVKPNNLKNLYFSSVLPRYIKKYTPPEWLEVDKDTFTGKVKRMPEATESGVEVKDIQAIIEFYSR